MLNGRTIVYKEDHIEELTRLVVERLEKLDYSSKTIRQVVHLIEHLSPDRAIKIIDILLKDKLL